MPIYEYRCRDCDHHFQRLQPVTAANTGLTCPRCGSEQVERLLSSFASTSSGATASGSRSCGGAPT